MIRCVLFDAAGTLFRVAEPVGKTYARIAGAHGIVVDSGAIEAGFRLAISAAPPLAFPGAPRTELRFRERAWWRRVVGDSFAACGVASGPPLDAAFDDIFAHFAEPHAWIVYPDVEPALERLRTIGTTLAVVSNFDGRLAPLLAAKGLAHHFSATVVSSEHGAAKPDPAIFRVALRACHADPRSTLHVGDSLDHDLRGARDAGILALLIDRGAMADAHTISSLLDLPARLG